ncbi:MAG: hypothetical protein AB1726_15785 [Planctomycetota bacterium]
MRHLAPSPLSLLLLASLPFAAIQEPPDPFVRVELANGVRAAILAVEGAERESFLTFLPLGLYGDGPHRAQFAHLLEHLVIRTTDPDSLQAEGLELNGETMGGFLRLDAYADPAHWREALARHRRWLAPGAFDAAVLAREKERIAGELAATVPAGFTHKWAAAAWSQVAGHGLPSARVRGDVEAATIAEAMDYAAERLAGSGEVLVVAAGPIPAAEVAKAIEAELGSLPARAPAKEARVSAPGPRSGDLAATWDLAARHYLEWYPVPAAEPADRAAAFVLAQRLAQLLYTSEDPRLASGTALATLDFIPPLGRAITISVSLGADAVVEEVRAALRAELDGVLAAGRRLPAVEVTIAQLRGQVGQLPAFDALRRQLAGRGSSALVEAQIALNLASQERVVGLTTPALAAALETLDAPRVAALASERLNAGNRSSLRLEPVR